MDEREQITDGYDAAAALGLAYLAAWGHALGILLTYLRWWILIATALLAGRLVLWATTNTEQIHDIAQLRHTIADTTTNEPLNVLILLLAAYVLLHLLLKRPPRRWVRFEQAMERTYEAGRYIGARHTHRVIYLANAAVFILSLSISYVLTNSLGPRPLADALDDGHALANSSLVLVAQLLALAIIPMTAASPTGSFSAGVRDSQPQPAQA
jgi:hypothetical protein